MPATDVLYGHPVSQPARSVQWYLDYSGNTSVERKVVDLFGGGGKTPEYRAKFPMGQVPGFETADGLCFGESYAMLRYLSKDDASVQPEGVEASIRLDEYIGRHYSNVRKFTMSVVVPALLLKDEEKKNEGLAAVKPLLELYDKELGAHKYVVGDKLTLADFLFTPEVDQMNALGAEILAPYPNILAYFERLTSDVKGYKECYGGMMDALKSNA